MPYGTEAECYQRYMDALVLGPGNIDQAHTVGEWIAVEQLHEAVEVYTRLIEELCGVAGGGYPIDTRCKPGRYGN